MKHSLSLEKLVIDEHYQTKRAAMHCFPYLFHVPDLLTLDHEWKYCIIHGVLVLSVLWHHFAWKLDLTDTDHYVVNPYVWTWGFSSSELPIKIIAISHLVGCPWFVCIHQSLYLSQFSVITRRMALFDLSSFCPCCLNIQLSRVMQKQVMGPLLSYQIKKGFAGTTPAKPSFGMTQFIEWYSECFLRIIYRSQSHTKRRLALACGNQAFLSFLDDKNKNLKC